jgi:methyl-accepting chemotaxis protein
MKLRYKVSLWIGLLIILIVTLIGFSSVLVADRIISALAEKSMGNQAKIAAALVKDAILDADLKALNELASQPGILTEEGRAALLPAIDRLGYLDFGIVGTDGMAHYLKDNTISNLADRDYVRSALAGRPAVSDVLISRVIGKAVLMFASPIIVNGRTEGALIGRKDGAVLGALTAKIGFGNTGYLYMINRDGVFVCHPNADLVYNQFNPVKEAATNPSLKSLAGFISGVLSGQRTFAEYVYEGKTMIGSAQSVPDTNWLLIGTIEKAEFFSEIKTMVLYTVLTGIAALVVSSILVMILTGFIIIRPLGSVTMEADALAEMNFEMEIPPASKDEIGDLLRDLSVIRATLKKTIADINNKRLGQLNISNNLHNSITSSSEGLGVINSNIATVREKTGSQMDSVGKTAESVEVIIAHIGNLETAVKTQDGDISRSSESIEKMVQGINSVKDVVTKATGTTGELSKSSETGQKMLANLTEELGRIAEQSTFLEQANEALVNIAAQTNILAMNAAIEAAHAGESGKGFAVVAGEIRKLAELSNKESSSISGEIKAMRDGINRIREDSTETVKTMERMFGEINNMEKMFDTVNTAVETQASGGRLILGALDALRDTTAQVHTSSDEIQKESAAIHSSVDKLKDSARDVNDSILGVQEASSGITESLSVARKIAEAHYLAPPDDAHQVLGG